uniref:Transmembrane phosphatase with tensin homology n=1 Tax=Astyanax mexicanus TaxID=7994 RepID=A0A3B1J7E3_ASTMX
NNIQLKDLNFTSTCDLYPYSSSSTLAVQSALHSILSQVLLIILDIALVIVDLSLPDQNEVRTPLEAISLVISFFFVIDVLLRVYVEGRSFLSETARVTCVFTNPLLVRAGVKIICTLVTVCMLICGICESCRYLRTKGGNKKDGFDLDLTYVTGWDLIMFVAVSFPSPGKQALYRNPIKEAAIFLDTKHPDHYRVYNLCSKLDHEKPGKVKELENSHFQAWISFGKKNKVKVKFTLCDLWNVIAIHCKGGKGDAEVFTDLKTSSMFSIYSSSPLKHKSHCNCWERSFRCLSYVPLCLFYCSLIYCVLIFYQLFPDTENNAVVISFQEGPVVCGDVKVMFESRGLPKGYEDYPFYFWFNTSFVENNRLYLSREELDNPRKSKTWDIYKEDFGVTVSFSDPALM